MKALIGCNDNLFSIVRSVLGELRTEQTSNVY